MARKAITIEDRVREFCRTATAEEIGRVQSICDNAMFFRDMQAQGVAPKPKRTRKPKEAPQARLAGVE